MPTFFVKEDGGTLSQRSTMDESSFNQWRFDSSVNGPRRVMSADAAVVSRGAISIDRPFRVFRTLSNGLLDIAYENEDAALKGNSLSKIQLRKLIESGELFDYKYRFTDIEVIDNVTEHQYRTYL